MVKVTVCIGSCCHTKGAGRVVERLQHLIAEANLKEKVDLAGKFAGHLRKGRMRHGGRGGILRDAGDGARFLRAGSQAQGGVEKADKSNGKQGESSASRCLCIHICPDPYPRRSARRLWT